MSPYPASSTFCSMMKGNEIMQSHLSTQQNSRKLLPMAVAAAASGVLLATLAVAPAYAASTSLGSTSCGAKTVVTRSQTTLDAVHKSVRNGVIKTTTFNGLLIFPETRRAYTNWPSVSSSSLATSGSIYYFNYECA